ncbi:MAG TPA: hypothetical protein VD788_03215 [Candidatus Polarisedimenticolaceae bacterium]|nr:hypothetical protein [Candidatus Polarisedimenticolaceae bacterium]
MTQGELVRIEQAVGVSLPADLRELYTHYPFAPDSWAASCAMPDDCPLLIRWNSCEPAAPSFGLDVARAFQIGTDGRDRLYFARLGGRETAILEADLDSGRLSTHDPDLLSWVLFLHAMHDRVDRDQQPTRP